MNRIKKSIPVIIFIIGIVALGLALFLFGEGRFGTKAVDDNSNIPEINIQDIDITTFDKTEEDICKENGKTVVYLFSTTWCPHCSWVKEAFDSLVKEYIDNGKIMAYHWELDTNDNTLTKEEETVIPEEHIKILEKYNPDGYVPTFIFGCKYIRIGTGHEKDDGGLPLEKAEFKKIIEELINS